MRQLLIGLLFLLCTTHVFAMDGNKLYLALSSSSSSADHLIAYAYIDASVSSIPYLSKDIGFKEVCVSDEVTNGQIYDVVRNYLEKYPEKRHLNAYLLTIAAVSISFQCNGDNLQ